MKQGTYEFFFQMILLISEPKSTISKEQTAADTNMPSKFSKLLKPKHNNKALETFIVYTGNAMELNLSNKKLTDQDMEIVAYYAIQENKVNYYVFHHYN